MYGENSNPIYMVDIVAPCKLLYSTCLKKLPFYFEEMLFQRCKHDFRATVVRPLQIKTWNASTLFATVELQLTSPLFQH